jgi:hypothetical protein
MGAFVILAHLVVSSIDPTADRLHDAQDKVETLQRASANDPPLTADQRRYNARTIQCLADDQTLGADRNVFFRPPCGHTIAGGGERGEEARKQLPVALRELAAAKAAYAQAHKPN